MRVDIISDLHLEFYPINSLQLVLDRIFRRDGALSDVLLLAGDLGRTDTPDELQKYRLLLQYCKALYSTVVFTAGNHCYYRDCFEVAVAPDEQRTLDVTNSTLYALAQTTGTIYLQQQQVIISGVRIVGCTLWSDVSDRAFYQLNDSRLIFSSPTQYRDAHVADVQWLKHALSTDVLTPTIVLTHHLPSFALIHPSYAGSEINSGFATELDALISTNSNIKAWVCGHTHKQVTAAINQCALVTNPAGYPGENVRIKLLSIEI